MAKEITSRAKVVWLEEIWIRGGQITYLSSFPPSPSNTYALILNSEWTLFWYKPYCFWYENHYCSHKLTNLHLHIKSIELCIKTTSTSASLPHKGQVTRYATVKWTSQYHLAVKIPSKTEASNCQFNGNLNSIILHYLLLINISPITKTPYLFTTVRFSNTLCLL